MNYNFIFEKLNKYIFFKFKIKAKINSMEMLTKFLVTLLIG